jgi:hypothetical protein
MTAIIFNAQRKKLCCSDTNEIGSTCICISVGKMEYFPFIDTWSTFVTLSAVTRHISRL